MTMHGCMRCLKFIVFTFNFVVWLAGMGVLGLAIWLRMDPKVNHYVRASYEGDTINTYYILCYILMATGGVMTFVGFLGCCGAFQESKCMLGTFFFFVFLILGAQVGGGVWAFFHRHELENSVTKTFKDMVQGYYGTTKDPLIDEAIDFVQSTRECCGGKGPADWRQSSWVQVDITQDKDRVPDSCCIKDRLPKGVSAGICGVGGSWVGDIHPAVYPKGCGEELVDFFKQNLLIIVCVGLGIAGTELLGMSFSLILCCAMRKSRGGGYKS